VVLFSCFSRLCVVDGPSMEDTLYHQENLLISDFAYTPKAGDIVVFHLTGDAYNKPIVKRVIAVEGETVHIEYGHHEMKITVVGTDGVARVIDEPYINEPTRLMGSYISLMMITENFSKEKPLVIEEGYFFAMGDNRNYSKDSREIGPIPVDELIGHAIFRFWPLNQLGTVDYDYEN